MARRPVWRLARGAAVGALVSCAAMAGHSVGGGAVAPVPALVVTTALTGISILLADREWTFATLLALMVGSQVAVHVALGLVASGHPGHAPASAAAPAPTMIATHVFVAVALAALARWGEVVVWRLASLTMAALGAVVMALAPVRPMAARIASTPLCRLRSTLSPTALHDRGPPRCVVA